MTRFMDKSFSTFMGTDQEYRDNWDACFGQRRESAQPVGLPGFVWDTPNASPAACSKGHTVRMVSCQECFDIFCATDLKATPTPSVACGWAHQSDGRYYLCKLEDGHVGSHKDDDGHGLAAAWVQGAARSSGAERDEASLYAVIRYAGSETGDAMRRDFLKMIAELRAGSK